MTVQMWLWIGTFGMSIGMILLFFPMQKNTTLSEEGDSISHFIVPVIAMTLYLVMALGHGSVTLATGRVFYYGRYIDWVVTTPLLLLSLVSSAVDGHTVKRGFLIAGLVASDVYMIITGLFAGLTDDQPLKWWLYAVSCISFLAIYALLWGPFRTMSLTGDKPLKGANYRKKLPVLTIVWLAYPFVFILGQEGMRLWSPVVDAALYTSLDLMAKVLYGVWAVRLASSAAKQEKEEVPVSMRARVASL